VREPQYGLNGIESRIRAQPKDDKRLRKWLFSDMEGLLELRKKNKTVKEDDICFVEEKELSPISSTEKDGHYISKEKREKEEKVLQKFRDAYKSGTPERGFKDGFMLPSEGNAKSTTQIVVKIRQVIFFAIQHVRTRLWRARMNTDTRGKMKKTEACAM
jgi:hypothetical protein